MQGIQNFHREEAIEMLDKDTDFALRDLLDAIERGESPKWCVCVQIMDEDEASTFRYNPFDLTKIWPQREFPLHEVGIMTLTRSPENYVAEVEQAAFAPANIVPGMGYPPDKMLQSRVLSYPDAHRHRICVNYDLLPVNEPKCPVHTYHRDGHIRFDENGGRVSNYEPHSFGGPTEDPLYRDFSWDIASYPVERYDHRLEMTISPRPATSSDCSLPTLGKGHPQHRDERAERSSGDSDSSDPAFSESGRKIRTLNYRWPRPIRARQSWNLKFWLALRSELGLRFSSPTNLRNSCSMQVSRSRF
jgi:hypothetical protein